MVVVAVVFAVGLPLVWGSTACAVYHWHQRLAAVSTPAIEDGALAEAQQEHERELREFDAKLRPALVAPPARSITGLFKQVYAEQQVQADLNADLFAVQFGRHAPDA